MPFKEYFEKWFVNYFSNEENRGRIFGYAKSFFSYIVAKKLIKNAIFYGVCIFALFTSVLRLNIDFKDIVINRVIRVSNVFMVNSMDAKNSLVADINKKAILEDNTNKVMMSDVFKIEKINHNDGSNFTAFRLTGVYNNYNKYRLTGDYSWNIQPIEYDKCKNLLSLFNEEKTVCLIQTINNSNTKEWINGCFIVDVMIKEVMKNIKINNDTSLLVCGIKYGGLHYHIYMYIGETYPKMQEFQRNIFFNKIIPVFNVKKTIN